MLFYPSPVWVVVLSSFSGVASLVRLGAAFSLSVLGVLLSLPPPFGGEGMRGGRSCAAFLRLLGVVLPFPFVTWDENNIKQRN